ncbi:MAG: murein transglycosylase A [Aestuariivirga sp.]|uniref:murein transglycosylase A n=1 Tax=Aestuariivirga sp. TaxID=2650926 RepID=UPI0025C0364E|nr:MltA domain-containing protein [Aestuariivirga sp.]MCA3561332.1 murein transglycosylase A [Aestuariivirga sp.]
MHGTLSPVDFATLEGWRSHDPEAAREAFRRSSREILEHGAGFRRPVRFGGSPSSWRSACLAAFAAGDARSYFERLFRAYQVHDPERPEGLFTGYYEPEVEGSRTRTEIFHVPVYRRPPDLLNFDDRAAEETGLAYGRLVGGKPEPYLTRCDIEEGALAGQGLEIVWLRDWADAFFIHIQGSGRVRLAEGGVLRLSYAAKSGHPYTGIGAILVQRGVLPEDAISMQAIRRWMKAHPREARKLMWENKSFVFFREAALEDRALGALGAQHVQLMPRRSLAVDRALWMFGMPVWLDTLAPSGQGNRMAPFRQLLVAQDTGSAIKGLARGDVYWGFGDQAAHIAGPMKSAGRMTVFLPVAVAGELGLPT